MKHQRWRLTLTDGTRPVFTCKAPITQTEAERLFLDERYGHAIAVAVVAFEPWRVT